MNLVALLMHLALLSKTNFWKSNSWTNFGPQPYLASEEEKALLTFFLLEVKSVTEQQKENF